MMCRFMDANGNGSREQAIKCIDWCLKQDVHIVSNSWGEVPNSLSLQVWGGGDAQQRQNPLGFHPLQNPHTPQIPFSTRPPQPDAKSPFSSGASSFLFSFVP